MANAVITGATNLSQGIGSMLTILADSIIGAKRARGHVINYCRTNPETTDRTHYVANFMVPYSGATVNNDVDGTAPAYQDSASACVAITLNQKKSVRFGFSQLEQTLDGGRSIEPLVAGRMADLFNAVETDICTLGSTFAASSGTANTNLTEATIDAARAALIANYIPVGVPLHAMISPGATSWVALNNLPTFLEYRIRGTQPDFSNESVDFGVKPIYHKNCYFVETQTVQTATITVLNTYNFMFAPDAILVAMKAPQIPTSPGVEALNFTDGESGIEYQLLRYWDKDTEADAIKLQCIYGRGLGRSDWGQVLLA